MSKLRLGIIGTNWISKMFVSASENSEKFNLSSVYSRRIETANSFIDSINKNTDNVYIHDNIDDFFDPEQIDVVYIASPNSLHFEQAKKSIQNGIHVIVEKPSFSNPSELKKIFKLLEQNKNVLFFEAARHIYTPNFKTLSKEINNLDHIDGGQLIYRKYSSKFDEFLEGKKTPNVFTAKFSAGALYDLGVYPIYDAVKWFGMPNNSVYYADKIDTGTDISGNAILEYNDFKLTINIGKNSSSFDESEIFSGKETISMSNPADLKNIGKKDEKGAFHSFNEIDNENPMFDEALYFGQMISSFKSDENEFNNKYKDLYEEALRISENVSYLLYDLRKSAEITFPADIEG